MIDIQETTVSKSLLGQMIMPLHSRMRITFPIVMLIFACCLSSPSLCVASYSTCINISGKWQGYLDLVNVGRQLIGAQIQQNGCNISISTTSHLPYGHFFVGDLEDWNYILASDQKTGEIWSTYIEKATRDRIVLYDFVNNYSGLDKMFLERVAVPGDIDNNSIVDLADAILSLQVVINKKTATTLQLQSDVNEDSRIGTAEAIYILNFLMEK